MPAVLDSLSFSPKSEGDVVFETTCPTWRWRLRGRLRGCLSTWEVDETNSNVVDFFSEMI